MNARVLIRTLFAAAFALAALAVSWRLHAQSDAGVAPTSTASAVPADPTTVTITISVYPSRKATVHWGKKHLGVIKPRDVLVVRRPRDSGPLDLVIHADGYLPVQTRAFTFSDSKLAVRLTPVDQKATLLGYREELPEGGVFDQIDVDAGGATFP